MPGRAEPFNFLYGVSGVICTCAVRQVHLLYSVLVTDDRSVYSCLSKIKIL